MIVLVTGANSGIGLEFVRYTLHRDASTTVLMACRDVEKARDAVVLLKREFGETVCCSSFVYRYMYLLSEFISCRFLCSLLFASSSSSLLVLLSRCTHALKVDVRVELLDLASLASVRALATRVTSEFRQLDVLVNNAGIMFAPRSTTVDGIDVTFQVSFSRSNFARAKKNVYPVRRRRIIWVTFC